MVLKFKVLSLTIILFMICSCSTTPPIVVHDEYGEMLADNELFRKEASDCALQAKQGVQGTTLTPNSQKSDAVFAGIQLISFFSDNASCIKSKGWRIKE
jgi:hypothetical protein